MISLTAAAVDKVKGFLEQEKAGLPQGGLRIYIQGGGCSGPRYGLALDEAGADDRVFDNNGIKVIVDPMSLEYLDGSEVDYRDDPGGGGFAVNNPNAVAAGCGCGDSSKSGGCCGS
jgi:iron-sulfur cluster assembly accessory protein